MSIKRFILLFLLFVPFFAMAQMPGGEPVVVSNEMQLLNGNCYFVHVVKRGQTVYSITRAYGLKEYDAVVKKDIHFLSIGDTVWLPCKDKSPSPDEWKKINAEKRAAEKRAAAERRAEEARKLDSARTAEANKNATIIDGTGKRYIVQKDAKPVKNNEGSSSSSGKKKKKKDGKNSADTLLQHYRERIDEDRIVVSLMMPLNLAHIDDVDQAKIDEKGKPTCNALEFIQFYEGMMLAMERLEQKGIEITLNVVDVPDNKPETAERLFEQYHVAQSDFLIALLMRESFNRVAQLAKEARLPIVNPVSTREDILDDNIYVYKCQASIQSRLSLIFDKIKKNKPEAQVVIIHSGANNEKGVLNMATSMLDKRGDISYSLLNWDKSSTLQDLMKKNSSTVILSCYSQGISKNRIYSSMLLNKLTANKTNPPLLIAFDDWTKQFFDVDFSQLQQLSFTTLYKGWDMSNINHSTFFNTFVEHFKTKPVDIYPIVGHDIMLYFTTGVHSKGRAFWTKPTLVAVEGLLHPMSFEQIAPSSGFCNTKDRLYQLSDYIFREW